MNPPREFLPISSLSLRTGQNSKILGRVMKAWPIKEWVEGARSKAKRTFELKDSSKAVIQVTLFGFAARNSVDIVKNNSVVAVENFRVNTFGTSSTLTVVSHYESSKIRTIIKEISDASIIQSLESSPIVGILEIANLPPQEFVDVIGMIIRVSELKPVLVRQRNEEVMTREVTLLDSTAVEIVVTFWRLDATSGTISYPVGSMALIRNAQTSVFQGVRLSFVGVSSLELNPEIEEAVALRIWYENRSTSEPTQTLIQDPQAPTVFETLKKVIDDAAAPRLRFVSVVARPKELIGDPETFSHHFYDSCSKISCNTKAQVDPGTGKYWCRSCNAECDTYKIGMKLTAKFGNDTEDFETTLFNSQLEGLFPVSVPTLFMMSTCEKAAYSSLLQQCFVGINFRMTIKVVKEDSNELTWTIISMKSESNVVDVGVANSESENADGAVALASDLA